MPLPMTNISHQRYDYLASTALYSEASYQQRSYFFVLEQVAQASRLQHKLRQEVDNPSLNVSLRSANFDIITQKIGNFFHWFPSSSLDHSDASLLFLVYTFTLSSHIMPFLYSFTSSGPSLSGLDNPTISFVNASYCTPFHTASISRVADPAAQPEVME